MDKLEGLHPKVKTLALKLIAKCKEQGISIIITQGYRSIADQNKLYAKGRTTPGKIVTRAKGGSSYHNFGLAFDFVPVEGKTCLWNREDLFDKVGAMGKALGLTWGGDFKSIVDKPHFQYTFNLTLKDLQNGKKP